MLKNYYKTLGISFNASSDQIKKAYRLNAVRYHPDKNLGDPIFADKFLEIKEAYDVLIDPKKRFEYNLNYINEFVYNENTDSNSKKYQEEVNEQNENFRYDPYKPFYSSYDREQEETPQFSPIKSAWGSVFPENAIFFKLPVRIGKLIYGFTDYFKKEKLNTKDLIRNVVKENLGMSIFFSLLITSILYYFTNNVALSALVFFVILIAFLLRMYQIDSGKVNTEYINYFIGINGFAYFKKFKNTEELSYKLEINFNDLTDLIVRIEDRSFNFKYVTTAYQYLWINKINGKIIYEYSATRDKNINTTISQLTEHEYWLNIEAEKYWTVYLLDNMEKKIQDSGYLEFHTYSWNSQTYYPLVRIGVGYIHFLDGDVKYKFDDINKLYFKGAEMFIEHKNYKQSFYFIRSGNKNSIDFSNLCNRQFFIKSIEILLGYKVSD